MYCISCMTNRLIGLRVMKGFKVVWNGLRKIHITCFQLFNLAGFAGACLVDFYSMNFLNGNSHYQSLSKSLNYYQIAPTCATMSIFTYLTIYSILIVVFFQISKTKQKFMMVYKLKR